MTQVDGNTFAGVSAAALWTLRDHAVEAKHPAGVVDDPWAVKLFDAICYYVVAPDNRGNGI